MTGVFDSIYMYNGMVYQNSMEEAINWNPEDENPYYLSNEAKVIIYYGLK